MVLDQRRKVPGTIEGPGPKHVKSLRRNMLLAGTEDEEALRRRKFSETAEHLKAMPVYFGKPLNLLYPL